MNHGSARHEKRRVSTSVFPYIRPVIYRPLASFGFVFYVLSCFILTSDIALKGILSAVGLLFFVLFILLKRRLGTVFPILVALSLAVLLSGVFCIVTHDMKEEKLFRYDGTSADVTATVTDCNTDSFGRRHLVLKSGDTYISVVSPDEEISVGDTVHGRISFSYKADKSYFDLTRAGEMMLSGKAEGLTKTGDGTSPIYVLKRFNSRLCEKLVSYLGERDGGVASALILGNKSHLDEKTAENFRTIGGSHILALSGMHLAVICLASGMLFSFLSKRFRDIIRILTVIFYMLLTGFLPSLTRAGIMLILICIAFFFRRKSDPATNLSAALVLITLIEPSSLYDIGLQLSAAATFAIIITAAKLPRIRHGVLPRLLEYSRFTILASVSVTVFMLPLEWLYFGSFSLLAPVTSLVIGAVATLLLYVLPLSLLLLPSPNFATVFFAVPKFLLGTMTAIADYLSRFSFLTVSLDFPAAGVLCGLLSISILLIAAAKKKLPFAIASATIFSVLLICSYTV